MQTRCVLENLPLPFRISFLRAASVRAYSPRRFTGEERRPAAYLVEYLTTLDSRGRCTYRVVTLRSRQHREAVHARVRARVRARSVLSKSLGAFLDSASLGLTRPWRGLACRCFDRSPLFRRHTAPGTCYEKCRRNYIFVGRFLRYYFTRFVEFLNFIRSFLIKEYIFYPKYYLYENYFVSIKNFKMQQG